MDELVGTHRQACVQVESQSRYARRWRRLGTSPGHEARGNEVLKLGFASRLVYIFRR